MAVKAPSRRTTIYRRLVQEEWGEEYTLYARVGKRKVGTLNFAIFPTSRNLRRFLYHDYTAVEGPFFFPDEGEKVIYLYWISTDGRSHTHGAFNKFIASLKEQGLPVYANFFNQRLQKRFLRQWAAAGCKQVRTLRR